MRSAGTQSKHGVPGDEKNFLAQHVAATNAKDIVRVRSFLYPNHLRALTPENKDYYVLQCTRLVL